MQQDYNSAFAYIAALTQSDANTAVVDFRCIHDTDAAQAGHKYRGTLPQLWQTLCDYNARGWGIFANINEMDGSGNHTLANVASIRVAALDLDNLSAPQNYERAVAWYPAPSFAVQTSPGKYHVYWQVASYVGNDRFQLLQRKLRQLFDGDKTVIDPTRILRVPGFYHCKREPHLVTVWALASYGVPIQSAMLEFALAGVNVVDGAGSRRDLGDTALQAPGLDWLQYAINRIDPNELERGEWISVMSAFKQSGWNWAPEAQLFDMFSEWCFRYRANNPGENLKNWNSIRNTEVGWKSFERYAPEIIPMLAFGNKQHTVTQSQPVAQSLSSAAVASVPMPELGEFLTDDEQQEYFKGCTFVSKLGTILTNEGRFMNSTQFNGTFGGKVFVINSQGKTTTEPWAAATRSSLWTVPKADHIRFVPSKPHGSIIIDGLGRKGINTYKPAIINSVAGDVSPFLQYMERLLPSSIDRDILFAYLAHNVRYPGHKIPWAPLLQSVEGAGKGIIKELMSNALGGPYCYFPKAQELIESGSKFNGWMRSKLFILVDEIKVDERRDMIEVLKPMISEEQIEIQSKGVDQDIEDNFANWCFFSNYKDAIPIDQNSRRFATFFSPIQQMSDLKARGMDDAYFHYLRQTWFRDMNGVGAVTHWLQNYPVERGAIPMRAPLTTSTHEAIKHSRSPAHVAILEAIEDCQAGFRGGWISSLAVAKRIKLAGIRPLSAKTLRSILEGIGYHFIGRAARQYFQESTDARTDLYAYDQSARIDDFGRSQGYEG